MLFMQRDKAINMYCLTCNICIFIVIFINRIHEALLWIIRLLVVIHRPRKNTRSNEGNKIFTTPTKSVKNCEGSKTTKVSFGYSVTYEAGHTPFCSRLLAWIIFLSQKCITHFICEMPSVTNTGSFRFARACEGNFSTVWWTQRAT